MDTDETPQDLFHVVINDEEQYSIWEARTSPPAGWRRIGDAAPRASCLDRIRAVWTDMRPASARRAPTDAPALESVAMPSGVPLVARLREEQPVEPGLRPARAAHVLGEQFDLGRVFVRFVRTGTELCVTVDPAASSRVGADFQAGTGTVRLVGELVLDGKRARCHASFDLATLEGIGRLEDLSATGA